MIQSSYSVRVLEPAEGWLTQNSEVELTERILSKKLYLAVTDDPANWKEISDAEAEEIRAAIEELQKAEAPEEAPAE